MASLQDLMGNTIVKIEGCSKDSDRIIFELENGRKFCMEHQQDCCESVKIEDVCGDINDLIGSPIVRAEESSSSDEPKPSGEGAEWIDSWTWTFYILGTSRGTVTLRWLGTSNGWYSERVDFVELKQGGC